MMPALLHGKLSKEQQNMEDVLTSTVFGLLEYVDSNEGVLPFLSRARYFPESGYQISTPITARRL
jgi:hypothetical protein